MRQPRVWVLVGALSALVAGWGCRQDGLGTGGEGGFRLLLTDAPSDLFGSVEVTLSRVYLVPASGGTEFVDLLPENADRTVDLMTLRDGVETELSRGSVPAGSYSQLRLVVSGARLDLVENHRFADGSKSRNWTLPPGDASGIKVLLESPIPVPEGGATTMVVDFDIERSFQIRGSPESPAGIQDVLFAPVLQEQRREASAAWEAPAD